MQSSLGNAVLHRSLFRPLRRCGSALRPSAMCWRSARPPSWMRLVTMTRQSGEPGGCGRTSPASLALSVTIRIGLPARRLRYSPCAEVRGCAWLAHSDRPANCGSPAPAAGLTGRRRPQLAQGTSARIRPGVGQAFDGTGPASYRGPKEALDPLGKPHVRDIWGGVPGAPPCPVGMLTTGPRHSSAH